VRGLFGDYRWFQLITSDTKFVPSWPARPRVGRIDLLVNSGELCRSIANGSSTAASCFEAMEAEFMPGDTRLLDRTNGAGITVRYLLPRTSGVQISLPLKSN
jgi:hypothetical protein